MKLGNIHILDLRQELPVSGPSQKDAGYARRALAETDLIVVHHSGVDADSTAWQIAGYHRDVLGWPGIGYHFLVHGDGRTEYVGDILTVRYHAGPHNEKSIGVCLTGNFVDRSPSDAQLQAARELLANLQFALGRPIPVVGHHELMATACPGDTFLRKEPFWGQSFLRRMSREPESTAGAESVALREEGMPDGGALDARSFPEGRLVVGHGIHWRNDPWIDKTLRAVEEADFAKFALGRFDWVTTICHADLPPDLVARHLDVYRRLRAINPRVKFIVRLNLAGPARSSDFVAAFVPRLEELREFTDLFQIHNEPNHSGEHFGGASNDSAWRYRWWHQRVVAGLREAVPWAKLGFPALAVMQREEAWLDICAPAIEMSDFLGCHVYWQYDNWASPDWGGRHALFARAFPEKDLFVTEYGDSTPGRPVVEKARIYRQWLKLVQSGAFPNGRIKAACTFILSSPDAAWAEFSLDEEACRIMGDN